MQTKTTVTVAQFARAMGVATWTAYESIKTGTCPIQPIRLGGRIVFSAAALAKLLEMDTADLLALIDGDGQAAAS